MLLTGAGIIAGVMYKNSTFVDYTPFFRLDISRAGVEQLGQPIEGFSAFMYLEAIPGLIEADFDGVKTPEGIYKLEGGELKFKRTVTDLVISGEESLSNNGYKKFLKNLSKRLDVKIKKEADITILLEKVGVIDVLNKSFVNDDFILWYPEGWYSYKNNHSIFFTHTESLAIPGGTEIYALAPWFQVSVLMLGVDGNPKSVAEMFSQNLWVEGSEFLVSKSDVFIKDMVGTRVVTKAAGAGGEELHYVFLDNEKVFTLSHYPYESGSRDTDNFERLVKTFTPNNFFDDKGDDSEGILPLKSGVFGVVLVGPICPVMKDPPDPDCNDKPYSTIVQVIAIGSPKSSPFATAGSDKDGKYEVILPPGEYSVQAIGEIPFPQCETKNIIIAPDTMYELDLLCDTGIR